MKLLSFYLGRHDSNFCTYDYESGEFSYTHTERPTGHKRHVATLKYIVETCGASGFAPDLVAYSDGGRNGLGSCDERRVVQDTSPFPGFPSARCINVDHHLCHALSAWPMVGSEEVDVGVVVDGQGDHLRRVSVFERPSTLKPPSFASTGYQIGHLLVQIGITLKLEGQLDDFAGKLMGAHAYGRSDEDFVRKALGAGIDQDVFRLFRVTKWRGEHVTPSTFYDMANPEFLNWLSSVHKIGGELVGGLFKTFCEPSDLVVYAGGCALNTVYNEALFKGYPKLVVPPHCPDSGLSIGCIEAARIYFGLDKFRLDGFPFIQNDENFGFASAGVIDNAAQLLSEGKILGWVQGRGEVGPRALGHRSILVSPKGDGTKDRLNAEVKHREYWRPFAASILWERQSEWLRDARYSPYMLSTAQVNEERRREVPAVVHVDGSTRYQSVDDSRMPELETFATLLREFERGTGLPLLLNTSYNAGGKPIVASRGQAEEFFWKSKLDGLVVGDELLLR